MTTSTAIILVLGIAVIALALVLLLQRTRTRKLRTTFGPEYDRVVDREGNTRRAEAVLDSRQKRVHKFEIRHLSHEEAERFTRNWRLAQERFVDDPRQAVADADRLINDALRTRGYPMAEFDQQAADISVEYPRWWRTIAPLMLSRSATSGNGRPRKICDARCNTTAICSST